MKSFEQIQYEKLIIRRTKVDVLDKKTYPGIGEIELHHIQPKSLNGSDDDNNLVYLFPREHYIAHLLLQAIAKQIYGEKSKEYGKMLYAFKMMGIYSYKQNRKFRMNSHLYEQLKLKSYGFLVDNEFRQKISESKRGEKNPNFGKFGEENPNFGSHRTEEQKQHISDSIKAYYKIHPSKKGKLHHSFGRITIYNKNTLKIKRLKKQDVFKYIKTGDWIIGVPEISNETRQKMSESGKKKIITLEHRQKMIDGTRKNMKGSHGKIIKQKISESMKKLIWIYNPNINKKAIRVLPEEFGDTSKYRSSDGWKRGRPSLNVNKIWLHNNTEAVRIDAGNVDLIQQYLDNGYIYGSGNHNTGPKQK